MVIRVVYKKAFSLCRRVEFDVGGDEDRHGQAGREAEITQGKRRCKLHGVIAAQAMTFCKIHCSCYQTRRDVQPEKSLPKICTKSSKSGGGICRGCRSAPVAARDRGN